MPICKECLKLLEHHGREETVVERDLTPLALLAKRCTLCFLMCKFFQIPVDSIRNGKVWPTVEDVTSQSNDELGSLGLHRPGRKLKHFVKFKVAGTQDPVRELVGDVLLRGPGQSFPSPDSVGLPLRASNPYRESQSTLGICLKSTGMCNDLQCSEDKRLQDKS